MDGQQVQYMHYVDLLVLLQRGVISFLDKQRHHLGHGHGIQVGSQMEYLRLLWWRFSLCVVLEYRTSHYVATK